MESTVIYQCSDFSSCMWGGCETVCAKTFLGVGAHDWFLPERIPYQCCRKCGVVRRTDGKNSPCRGRVVLSLRDDYTEG